MMEIYSEIIISGYNVVMQYGCMNQMAGVRLAGHLLHSIQLCIYNIHPVYLNHGWAHDSSLCRPEVIQRVDTAYPVNISTDS